MLLVIDLQCSGQLCAGCAPHLYDTRSTPSKELTGIMLGSRIDVCDATQRAGNGSTATCRCGKERELAVTSLLRSHCKGERMPVVSLRDVVEALDWESDEMHSCLDPDTGEIVIFNDEEASIAASGDWDAAPEWMRESLPKIRRALEDDRMLALPDRVHIDEWRMMQDFAEEQEECRCRPELFSAVHGVGAFRRFKDAIRRLGLEESWFRYREAAFEQVAKDWLEANKIPYR